MSKIEKALSRARRDNALVVIPKAKRPEQVEGSRDVAVVEGPERHSLADSEAQVRASEAIARMREPVLRDPRDLALRRIIHPDMVGNDTAQAFREIRTKILQRTKGRNAIILVTSVAPRSGSTFVALNLGAAFAFDAGKTALLVDCNLRNPWFQTLLASDAPKGLTDYLEDAKLDIGEIIQQVGIERLRVIPAGSRRDVAGEYFTTPRIKRLFDGLRRRYAERFVILDAPPMAESADTKILSDLSDYVLLVVSYGEVTATQVDDAIRSIDAGKFLGVVYNNDARFPEMHGGDLARQAIRQIAEVFIGLRDRLVGWMGVLKSLRRARSK